jgi:hypothetical protein
MLFLHLLELLIVSLYVKHADITPLLDLELQSLIL